MISDTTARSETMVGDGTQTRFDFAFDPVDSSYIDVWSGNTVTSGGYSTTITGSTNYVTFSTPPTSGTKIAITRDVPVTQLVDLQNQTAFYPEVLEKSYDKLTAICQELLEKSNRSVVFPPTMTVNSETYQRFLEIMGSTTGLQEYVAGDGIEIYGATISVSTTSIQRRLVAGANISINQSSNVISASYENTTYDGTDGVKLSSGTVFSADWDKVQKKLTAGSNISINANNVISATAPSFNGIPIDTDSFITITDSEGETIVSLTEGVTASFAFDLDQLLAACFDDGTSFVHVTGTTNVVLRSFGSSASSAAKGFVGVSSPLQASDSGYLELNESTLCNNIAGDGLTRSGAPSYNELCVDYEAICNAIAGDGLEAYEDNGQWKLKVSQS